MASGYGPGSATPEFMGSRARRLDSAALLTGQLVVISDAARADMLALGYPDDVVSSAPVVRAALHPELVQPTPAAPRTRNRHRLPTLGAGSPPDRFPAALTIINGGCSVAC